MICSAARKITTPAHHARGGCGWAISLWDNKIGDEGMKAFSSALSSGSLDSLKKVVVQSGHEELPYLVAACRPRGIEIG